MHLFTRSTSNKLKCLFCWVRTILCYLVIKWKAILYCFNVDLSLHFNRCWITKYQILWAKNFKDLLWKKTGVLPVLRFLMLELVSWGRINLSKAAFYTSD